MSSRPWTERYDPGVPTDLPIASEGLSELLENAVRRFPDGVALSYFGREVSYWRLFNLCDALASHFQRRSVEHGRVALLLPNCPQFVIALLAALRAGLSVVALPPDLDEDELQRWSSEWPCDAAVVLDSGVAAIKAVRPEWPLVITSLREYLPAAVRPVSKGTLLVDVTVEDPDCRLESLMRRTRAPAVAAPQDGSVIHLVAEGQAASFTPAAVAASARQLAVWPGRVMKTGCEKILAAHPLHSLEGQMACLGLALASGSTLVLTSRVRFEDILGGLASSRPTLLAGPTSLFADLSMRALAPARRSALRSLRWVLSTGEALDLLAHERFEELADCPMVLAMAWPETGYVCATRLAAGRGSGAVPLPGVDVRVTDGHGQTLGSDEPGWLSVRGPQCRLNGAESWVDTRVPARLDGDGFLHVLVSAESGHKTFS